MNKILVTGATGFTGKALCKKLVDEGHTVVAFVRASSDVRDLTAWGVESRVVTLTDAKSVASHFEPFQQVYHIAAAYRSEHAERDEFWRVNVEGTRNLLDAAKNNGVGRFVHCSTVGVQGEIENPPATEDYRSKPGDHYQDSKLEGELLALRYFSDGLPGVVVRPVGIHGPGDLRFLKLFKTINKGQFLMIGNGQTLYHMTFIDDLVDGFILAGETEGVEGEVFTIGGPQYTTLRVLVDTVAEVLDKPKPKWRVPYFPVFVASVVCDKLCRMVGVSPPLYPRRVEFFHLDRAFSIEKAKQRLDYQPKYDLRRGLQVTADWYKQEGLL